ncbi:MAG: hypothetical protein AAGF36_06230 [Pseudomonadota bacterium]
MQVDTMRAWLDVSKTGQMWLERRVAQRPTRWRWLLAGPLAFLLSIFAMAGLPSVLPAGAGGVNHLVLPVVLFPLLWASFVVWPVAAVQIGRVASVYIALFMVFLVLIVLAFLA